MFQVLHSFIDNIADHRCWNQSEPDCHHEDSEDSIGLVLVLFLIGSHREWCRRDLKLKLRVSSCLFENRLVHELRVQGSDVLGSKVQESANFERFSSVIGLVDKVRAIAVGLEITF